MKPKTKPAEKAHKSIVDHSRSATPGMDENSMEFIIAKKPKAAKVRKFIQQMIDDIVAEQE